MRDQAVPPDRVVTEASARESPADHGHDFITVSAIIDRPVARERLERMLDAITLAGNAAQVREEIAELRQLAGQAQTVEASDAEAKLSKLSLFDYLA